MNKPKEPMTRTRKRTNGRAETAFPTPLRLSPPAPMLRFSLTAWAKLVYLRDRGPTEIGGFGVCSGEELLRVDEIQLVDQTCPVTVKFDDVSVADFFEAQVDRGLRPEQFGRVWVDTHPGESPMPSSTDEETFGRAFGRVDWAVMFILAQGGQTYARLRFNVGPGGSLVIPVEVDYTQPFAGSDWAAWEQEYARHIRQWQQMPVSLEGAQLSHQRLDDLSPVYPDHGHESPADWRDAWEGFMDEQFGVVWPDADAAEQFGCVSSATQEGLS